ncbi:O-fucosyltransferase 10 [Cornus florida]|uniref:O-fucosyltransferase 10 n=1 Tax=Cornus florida TaxID=4283 RepID=UPI0028A059B5|nr:O-fucosyltransferase 10 [Cornus florida]
MNSSTSQFPPMKPKTHYHNTTATTTTTTATANGYSSDSGSPSPPPSPRHHSSLSLFRRRRLPHKTHSHSRRESLFAGMFRRQSLRYFVLLSLLYVSGLIMCVGPFSAMMQPRLPGSVYRSHQIFQKLWHEIESDNSSAIELSSVWRYKRKLKEQKSCPNITASLRDYESLEPGHYLIVDANGGLNQQRSSICNAVAVARLLDATLVIPRFDFNSVWRDPSGFSDIYDEDHFITTIEGYVKVVRELPEGLMERYDFNISNIPNFRVQAWAPASYYSEEVYPVLRGQGVIRIAPFANRLAMNVPPHIQFVRCLANYEALRFSIPINTLAKKLVNRMIEKSTNSNGKYVSVHLRFEEDMVAFSCCEYDGGRAEKFEMDLIREKGWGDKFKRKGRVIAPGVNRINGRCPMTPLEVGMMLRGMGFANDTPIYLASGKIYQAERNLAPLLKMFPLLHTKESLATPDELASFQGYSSRLAALDYMVCLFSEVFVTTQGGNFPHFLMGHRRFIYDGHAKTIKPDKSKLAVLLEDTSMSWKDFKEQMEAMLAESDRKGIMIPRVKKTKRKASIYANPLPECRCLWESQNSTFKQTHASFMTNH